MSSRVKHFYDFGPFRLDADRGVLLRNGKRVQLTPKAFDTLLVLVRNNNEIVSKDELMKAVWPDTFVEEVSLARNVSVLRKLFRKRKLGSIETIPKRGYRFVGKVTELWDDGVPANSSSTEPSAISHPIIDSESILPRWWRIAGLLLIFVVGGAIIALTFVKLTQPRAIRSEAAPTAAALTMAKLTNSGNAKHPAISADGKYVVHVIGDAGRESLWLRQVGSEGSAQIVPPTEVEYLGAAFSHDGRYIYYATRERNRTQGDLFQVPILGGSPRKLITGVSSSIALSPDGGRIAFSRYKSDEGEFALMAAALDGSGEKKITVVKTPDELHSPSWSPDGKTIAYTLVKRSPAYGADVAIAQVNTGVVRTITTQSWWDILHCTWMPDGTALLITARDSAAKPYQIWRLAYPNGEPKRITNDLNSYRTVSVTADNDTIVTVKRDMISNIWVAPDGDASRARSLTPGAAAYFGLSWVPGGKIVYASSLSGGYDLWIMEGDGSSRKQLTFQSVSNLAPCASADGKYVFFVSYRAGTSNIWRINIDGSDPKQITYGPNEYWPQCSADGRWVVYHGYSGGIPYLWRIPVDGGEPLRLTEAYSRWPGISPDASMVACFYRDGPEGSPAKIAVLPIGGGKVRTIVEAPPTAIQSLGIRWTPDGQSLMYVDNRAGVSNVWRQPINGGAAVQLTNFKSDQIFSFDWSGDGKLTCSRGVETSDVVLIRDFKESMAALK